MKKIIVLIILITGTLLGCKKSDTNTDHPNPAPPDPPKTVTYNITLNNVEGSGGTVKLSWSALDVNGFNSYAVMRSESVTATFTEIYRTSDKQQTTYVDNDVPFAANVRYKILASSSQAAQVTSNIVSYDRNNLKLLDIKPNDILYNKEDQLLYIIERGGIDGGIINIYDIVKNEIIKSVKTSAVLSYADFGIYNGRKELYVPGDDGNILIYDAVTLAKITQISTGLSNYSVVYYKNNLYISTSKSVADNPVVVISRVNGKQISETGFFPITRLKHVPNTDFDLLEITSRNTTPVDQAYYKFSSDGKFLSRSTDLYSLDNPLDDKIFEIFPDGSKYITTSSGEIYNMDMTRNSTLPHGNLNFTSFTFDEAQSVVYAATRTKTIEVYNLSNMDHTKSYSTSAYPYKIVDIGNQLLCISVVAQYKPPYNEMPVDILGITVEKINK